MRRDQRLGLVGLALAHARGRLVEAQQLRFGGKRDADFEIALLAVRQIAGKLGGLAQEADGIERRLGLAVDIGKGAVMRDHVPAVPARLRGDAHVFQRRGIGQDIGDLIGARDALLRDRIGGQPGDLVAVENDAAARSAATRRSGN